MMKNIFAAIGVIFVVYQIASGYDALLRGRYERKYGATDKPA
jgi:hypothetical protein